MGTAARDLRLPPLVRQTLEAFVAGLRRRSVARLVTVRLFGSMPAVKRTRIPTWIASCCSTAGALMTIAR
jgi:hypothetical protein